MAIWQFVLSLIPNEWANENRGHIDQFLTEDGWDMSSSWKESACRDFAENVIDQFLPRTTSWSDDLILWAHAKSDSDIHLFRDGADTVELEIRIDVRAEYSSLVENSVSVANQLNCAFFLRETATVITPSSQLLDLEIQKSRAMRFVRDPIGTLSED